MTIEQLRLFRDIAHQRSLSRGAQLNGISQSAASQHLQEMERQLGVPLLDRSTRPVELTECGRLYLEFCRDVLHLKEKLDSAMDRLKGRVEGTVRVASIYSVGISEMSWMEEEFSLRQPDAELRVEYLRPEKVYEAVLSDQVDLGLVSYPAASREIQVVRWREERMVVAMAPSHPLAGLSLVKASDLNGEDFVGFDQDLPIHREVNRFLAEHGVEVNVVLHFDNIQSMKEAIALGAGLSILPERVLRTDIEQKRLFARPLEAPGLVRPLGVIHRRRKRFNAATQAFLELLMEKPAPNPTPIFAA
ncbi:MAG TPA: LysR family transcriptional regulator [Bryobacteraceae bacterium]|nr:LysR family transcriptional regulator [Bryobacteraceae bacterium]